MISQQEQFYIIIGDGNPVDDLIQIRQPIRHFVDSEMPINHGMESDLTSSNASTSASTSSGTCSVRVFHHPICPLDFPHCVLCTDYSIAVQQTTDGMELERFEEDTVSPNNHIELSFWREQEENIPDLDEPSVDSLESFSTDDIPPLVPRL